VTGVQGDGGPGHEEAIEVQTVIWIGIAAIIVIATVIAAIGQPPAGPGRQSRDRGVQRSNARRRVGSYSGGGYVASSWSGDTGSGSCGGDGGGSCGGDGGGSCGGGI
jgi:hypothetical protein